MMLARSSVPQLATLRSSNTTLGRRYLLPATAAGRTERKVLVGAQSVSTTSPSGDNIKRAADAATAAANAAADAVRQLRVPDMAVLDVDIKKTVTYNFIVQLVLTGVSWAIAFFTSHATLAKGAGVHPTTALLMVGVLLSGYSAYLSYTYLTKVKSDGLDVLQGWQQMKLFYEHLVVNFVGAAATILALQAEVGTLMMGGMTKQASGLAIQALAQASTNTLLAHLVSIVFLTFMIRKITAAYQRVLEWGESLAKSMPRL
eukprot:GHUV01001569.1.p1 GENE.GHUV01001569.1~~GHUV01001569.1.p1  ORF type:complete len:259 (+),score=78.83 GHUV01001569.1:88-864(+)